jgi:hypothetical protein
MNYRQQNTPPSISDQFDFTIDDMQVCMTKDQLREAEP